MNRIKTTKTGMSALIAAKKKDGLIVLETQLHKDGEFIVVGTQEEYNAKYPLKPPLSLEDRVAELESIVSDMKAESEAENVAEK